MPPLTQKIIDRFYRWCKKEYGRQTIAAAELKVPKQTITDWFSPSRKRNPTAEQILAVMKFLEEHDTDK
jgi:hypothetical protein